MGYEFTSENFEIKRVLNFVDFHIPAVTDHVLREAFECCGKIEHIRVVQSDKGCKGVAFVRFENPESCALALKLNGTSILEREIRVEKYKANKSPADKNVKKAKTPKAVQKKNNANKKAGKPAASAVEGGDKKKNKKKKEFLGVKSNDAKKVIRTSPFCFSYELANFFRFFFI